LGLAVAAGLAATLQASGGYYAIAGGIAGAALVVGAGILVVSGAQPSGPVLAFAGAFVLLGAWSVASTAWGGLPHTALRFLGLLISVAAAAVAASCLATSRDGQMAVVGGVGLGIVAHALIELVAVATHSAPAGWFEVRYLAGPVGYHNAEATILVVGLPIAIWAAASAQRYLRAAGATAGVLLVSTIMLTQSRGALVAATVSVVTQIAVSRRLRVAAISLALGAAGAVLFLPLRNVDRALISGNRDASDLTTYVLVTFLLGLVLGIASIPAIRLSRRPTRRHGLAALGVGVVILVVAGVASAAALGDRVDSVYRRLTVEPNSVALVPGGQTRFSSVSPTGRIEQWRVAAHMVRERPVAGYGTGTFARRWGSDRPFDLYVLQAHSIELELASELGALGLALGVASAVALGFGVVRGVRRERALGALAAAAALGFLTQASIDWIISFPAVAATVAALIAVASPGTRRAPGLARTLVYGMVVLAGVFALSGPALAAYQLDRAQDAGPARFATAWSAVTRARSFDRWDPAVVSYEGILTESAGKFELAASLYRRAAELSQQPWVDTFRRARVLSRAGLSKESRAACEEAIASDPLERILRTGPCQGM